MGRRWFCDRGGNLALTRDFTAALSGAAELPAFTDAALATHLATASEASFAAHAGSSNYAARPGETVLLTQHRADRAMQVATVLAETQMVCSLVELGTTIPAERVFFPTRPLAQGLAFELKARAIGSVRISETCKFPHVTYFINGLNRNLEGTQICLPSIPETEIASRPEMSIEQVHAAITAALEDPDNRVVIANIPNLDQVGHLGNFDAAAVAAFHVDRALAAILETCRRHGWTAIVTADHGNADRTRDEAGRPFGSHTGRPVPFTVVPAPDVRFAWTAKTGSLANVAPTLLAALDLPRPAYMTGSLIARAT